MKMIVSESSKVTVKVLDGNKIVKKISVGKRVKVEAVKELAAQYDIEVVNHEWKVSGIGGAGLWNSAKYASFNKFMADFAN